jgi:hypothetical protein
MHGWGRLHATSERCRIATSEKIRHREENQLVGSQARVPLYVPYADFFQYQAGPGRLADRA